MKLYSFLATRFGVLVLVLGALLCALTALQITHVIVSGHYAELRCMQYGTLLFSAHSSLVVAAPCVARH